MRFLTAITPSLTSPTNLVEMNFFEFDNHFQNCYHSLYQLQQNLKT